MKEYDTKNSNSIDYKEFSLVLYGTGAIKGIQRKVDPETILKR
jgi:hypothetical protein